MPLASRLSHPAHKAKGCAKGPNPGSRENRSTREGQEQVCQGRQQGKPPEHADLPGGSACQRGKGDPQHPGGRGENRFKPGALPEGAQEGFGYPRGQHQDAQGGENGKGQAYIPAGKGILQADEHQGQTQGIQAVGPAAQAPAQQIGGIHHIGPHSRRGKANQAQV